MGIISERTVSPDVAHPRRVEGSAHSQLGGNALVNVSGKAEAPVTVTVKAFLETETLAILWVLAQVSV
jgi:hypothetical protein